MCKQRLAHTSSKITCLQRRMGLRREAGEGGGVSGAGGSRARLSASGSVPSQKKSMTDAKG